ncbi:MAG: hypothetical protein MRERC_2c057 [Mycoplasmataceae bacterium RC_NB112A]|nr:MAG: hypothetical protein MRERC_2c057 [Mycoplasmataceae bacterium RC_NB112A]
MNEINQIFKIDDIKDNDVLKDKKISTINFLKRSLINPQFPLTKNPKTNYQASHLYWIIEEYKRFIGDLFKNYPDLHDPAKKPDVRKKLRKGWGDITDNSYKILRQRYKLFFTEKLDGNNWREKIRDAESNEKVVEIEQLIIKAKTDFSTRLVRRLKSARQNISLLEKKRIEQKVYRKSLTEPLQTLLIDDIKNIENFIYSQGQGIMFFVAYDLLKKEINNALALAQNECKLLNVSRDWKYYQAENPQPYQPGENHSPDNSEDDSDTDSENEKFSPQVLKKQLEEAKEELKKPDKISPNNKEKIEKALDKLQENSDNAGDESLRKEIEELRKELAKIKKTLKQILENTKDYTQKLFNWFKNKSVKKLIWQDNDELLVEKNNGKNEILSSEKVQQDEVLKQFKELSQQSEQKSLTFSELSQITAAPSLPDNTPNQKHWDKYGRYYIGTVVIVAIVVIVSAGAVFYRFWIKKHKK